MIPTPQDIYFALERKFDSEPEKFRWLGASLVGSPCARFVALSFRRAFRERFDGRTLRVFENGHAAEDRMVASLEATGIKVVSRQYEILLEGGRGHVGVTLDGVAEIDGEFMVLEMKTMKASDFRAMEKNRVREAKPRHYGQMQFGMLITGLRRALYVAENKDSQELYIESVDYDEAYALRLRALALSVLDGKEQVRVSERPDWYYCKTCPAHGVCHGDEFPRARCLTCCHSTAAEGGAWTCARHGDAVLDADKLRAGCDDHLWIPWLVNLQVEGWGEYWVTYRLRDGRRLCNCPAGDFPRIDDGDAPVIMTSRALCAYGSVGALCANKKGGAAC